MSLIDSRVSIDQCTRAIAALHQHQQKHDAVSAEKELLPGKEPAVWLNIAVKKIPAQRKLMPIRIPIPHTLIDPRTTSICLITKDPQRTYKDLLTSSSITFISRTISLSKLKGKFKPFEARRLLLKTHGLFLADDRVIPLLPKLLGQKWFDAKKQPVPVTLSRKDLKAELENAINSAYMSQNRGTNTAVRIATVGHTPKQILENLQAALPAIVAHIDGGWENVQALSIKTNSSVSLPIWSCSLQLDAPDADEEKKKRKRDEKTPASPSKDKKRKVESVEEKNVEAPTKKEAPAPAKKEKKKKAAPAPVPVEEPKTIVIEEVSASPPKKEKKKKDAKKVESAAAEPEVTPKPKGKKEKAAVDVEPTSEDKAAVKAKKSKKAAPEPAAAPEEPSPAKAKKSKKTAPEPAPTISPSDIKAKKSAAPGEKKKEKVVVKKSSGSASKSAKEAIIGKKGLTRI